VLVREVIEVPKTGDLISENVNGKAYVLEAHRKGNGNVFVLLFLPNAGRHKFATGLYVGSGWVSGHYFENVNEALYDWLERR